MNVLTSISLVSHPGRSELAGATDGAAWYLESRPQVDATNEGVFILDFLEVRIATVSWLREAVITLLRYTTTMKPNLVVVAANLTDLVKEELQVALEATGTVMIVAEWNAERGLDQLVLVGRLDPALSETLVAIGEELVFDAPLVCKALPHVGASAANNRLAALEAKNVLKSHRSGRSRVYSPVLEGLRYGY